VKVVVVGGSDAGIAAAMRIRELDPTAAVSLLLAEDRPNVDLGGIPALVGGEQTPGAPPRPWNDFSGIDLRSRHLVREIDVKANLVAFESAGCCDVLPYDRLILATGAFRPIPDLEGATLPGVRLISTTDDSDAINGHVSERNVRSVIVIGAGHLGLELAVALRRRGLSVTLISRPPHIMPVFDWTYADLLASDLTLHGVRIVKDAAAVKIEEGLRVLDSAGRQHEADLVLMATGLRPNAGLAAAAGAKLGVSGAIDVSRWMRTSLSNVFAAGNCVVTHHRLKRVPTWIALGSIARKQGRIAAENVLGLGTGFAGAVGTRWVKLFDLTGARTGLFDSEARAEGFTPLSIDYASNVHRADWRLAQNLWIRITGDRRTQQLLGVQVVGGSEADVARCIDAAAAALFWDASVDRLLDLDLSQPPVSESLLHPLQMAARHWLDQQRSLRNSSTERQERLPVVAAAIGPIPSNATPPAFDATPSTDPARPLSLATIPVAYLKLRTWSLETGVFRRRKHFNNAVAIRAALLGAIPTMALGALEIRQRTPARGILHVYAAEPAAVLAEAIRQATPALVEAGLEPDNAELVDIRGLKVGSRLRFKARIRPVAPRGSWSSDVERALSLTDVHALAQSLTSEPVDRYGAYWSWLSELLAPSAVLTGLQLIATNKSIVWVATDDGKMLAREGPDVLVEAQVTVVVADALARLLHKGLGEAVKDGFGFARLLDGVSE
jgi:NADPH-dependent 2,4-dienoyl-CoA reductase/sulfur reductase-like enzyme